MGTSSTAGSGKIVFSVPDVYGNSVILREGSWEHIERRHRELRGRQHDVKDAINSPDGKRLSTERDTCVCYETFGAQGIRVLVEYTGKSHEAGTERGKVITAYPPSAGYGSKVGPLTLLGKANAGTE